MTEEGNNNNASLVVTDQTQYGPLGDPLIRKWELTDNSTFYDGLVAAPSDATLQKMWLGWFVILFGVSLFTTTVLLPILLTPKTRRSPFNLYLIYMILSDTFMTLSCAGSCLVNYRTGHYVDSAAACYFQSFYTVFMICSNLWLNAMVSREVVTMLQSSQTYLRYQPPSHWQVTRNALLVYAGSAFLAMGSMCIPQPYDHASTAFFYGLYVPVIMLIPSALIAHAFWKLFRGNLLPPAGKRRTLALYLFRLSLAFVVMWLPTFLLIYLIGPWTASWIQWAGGTWAHLQAAVQSTITLCKPDIWEAFVNFYRCQEISYDRMRASILSHRFRADECDDPNSSSTKSWLSLTSRMSYSARFGSNRLVQSLDDELVQNSMIRRNSITTQARESSSELLVIPSGAHHQEKQNAPDLQRLDKLSSEEISPEDPTPDTYANEPDDEIVESTRCFQDDARELVLDGDQSNGSLEDPTVVSRQRIVLCEGQAVLPNCSVGYATDKFITEPAEFGDL